MDLDFSQEQDDLRDSIRQVLERECPVSLVRSIVEDRSSAGELWQTMVGLDWPALTVPEEDGGIGYGFVELAVLAEELGRAIAPGPLFPTVTQFVPTVREAGSDEQRKRFLGGVASGEVTGTLAVAEASGRWTPTDVATTARADGDGWALTGEKRFVVEAGNVDEIAVVARVDGSQGSDGVGVFVVPTSSVDVAPIDALDPSRQVATVTLDEVTIDADRCLGEPGPAAADALARALEEATTALALETLGTCQATFELNVDYANERVQFDRPIGSFQAVKHKLADGLVALERARATTYFAAACIAEDDARRNLATSVAKAAAGDCQRYVTREGIQLLGGIGYTWEHDMHLYVRRAKTGDSLLGTAAQHRERIAELVADRRLDTSGPRWTLDGR